MQDLILKKPGINDMSLLNDKSVFMATCSNFTKAPFLTQVGGFYLGMVYFELRDLNTPVHESEITPIIRIKPNETSIDFACRVTKRKQKYERWILENNKKRGLK